MHYNESLPPGATDWLSPVLHEARERNLCTRPGCTTCGSTEFMRLVQTAIDTRLGCVSKRERERRSAEVLAYGLACLRPTPGTEYPVGAIELLIMTVRAQIPFERPSTLEGSWAENVYERMLRIDAVRAERYRAHVEANDPVRVEALRAAKRAARQERHAEMLRRQRERSIEWHRKHGPPAET